MDAAPWLGSERGEDDIFSVGIVTDAPIEAVDSAVSKLLEEDLFVSYEVQYYTEDE